MAFCSARSANSGWPARRCIVARSSHRAASTLILAVAFTKVRLVGLYFMELREAPTVLRLIFEAYCVVVFAAMLGLYLAT